MKSLTLSLAILFTACTSTSVDKAGANRQAANNTQIKLIVVKQDNQNLRLENKTDTIFMKDVDLTKTRLDVYFSHDQFQIPYYLPTNSIYKDSIKEKECNLKIYPATVKCYEYDQKKQSC